MLPWMMSHAAGDFYTNFKANKGKELSKHYMMTPTRTPMRTTTRTTTNVNDDDDDYNDHDR